MIDVLHLLPSVGDHVAGLASAVCGLAEAQQRCGLETAVQPADATSFGRRSAALLAAAGRHQPRVLHSHGLWLSASRASRRWRRRGGTTVVAPHGMLDPWTLRRRRQLKQLLWQAGERGTLQRASCLQALCRAERDAIRALGITAPIALIPNGVTLPELSPAARTALSEPPWAARGVPLEAPVLLFLGRFHAKKGIAELLEAWRCLQEATPTPAWLVFAGFGDGGALALQLQRQPVRHTCVVGGLQGAAKSSALAHASGFVLPSFSEGLPMAALEAMGWGLPCLLSAACNLPESFDAGAAWPAPPDPGQLRPVLERWARTALNDPAGELNAMGGAGRELVTSHFSWPRVAAQTAELYRWLQGDAPRPAWVDTVA